MKTAIRTTPFPDRVLASPVSLIPVDADSPRRPEAEALIRNIFMRRYSADIKAFAPQLMLVEQQERVIAAAGWRGAEAESLFLERYLDAPIETLIERIGGQTVPREHICEVGNLASEKPGSSLHVILHLATYLERKGYTWVVFTATQQLIRIFTGLGIPLLALAQADPTRLGDDLRDWGNYYDTLPVVVTGRVRLALEKLGENA
jgi:Thermostable hemolysin